MQKDYCDITVVVDRSGSMSSIKNDAEGGLNAFIEKQKKMPGRATFSLVEFDDRHDWVYKGKDIQEVGYYNLYPRGSTALLDAVGKAINETGNRLRNMREEDRPGLVVFVVVTDGDENASKEFNRKQIREMTEHQTNKYNWQFTYLGANQDSFAEAGSMGFQLGAIANYDYTKSGLAYNFASENVSRMRCIVSSGGACVNAYLPEELLAMAPDVQPTESWNLNQVNANSQIIQDIKSWNTND